MIYQPTGHQTPMISICGGMVNTAGTYYSPIYTNLLSYGPYVWGTSAASLGQPMPMVNGGMISNLWVGSSVSFSGKYTFTLCVNGSPTSLSVTPGGTSGQNLYNTVLVNQGDLLTWQCVQASGAPNLTPAYLQISWIVTAYGSAQSCVLGGFSNGGPTNTGNSYGTPQGLAGSSAGTNGPFTAVPTPGTFKNLFVNCASAVSAGTWGVKFNHQGADQTLATTVTAGATTNNDQTHTVSVAAGDYMSMAIEPSGTPTAQTFILWGIEFDPTTPGLSLGGYDITPILSPETVFNGVGNTDFTLAGNEAQVIGIMPGPFNIMDLYGQNYYWGSSNGNSSDTITFTLRTNNGGSMADSTLTTTVSGPIVTAPLQNNDSTHVVAVPAGGLVSVKTVYVQGGVSTMADPACGLVFQYIPLIACRRGGSPRTGTRNIMIGRGGL